MPATMAIASGRGERLSTGSQLSTTAAARVPEPSIAALSALLAAETVDSGAIDPGAETVDSGAIEALGGRNRR
jgi:hypothetical protein